MMFLDRFRKSRLVIRFPSNSDKPEFIWIRWVIVGVLSFILVLFFPRVESFQLSDLKEGSISPRRIVAPFDFEILKTRMQYQSDRALAIKNIFPVFYPDPSAKARSLKKLQEFMHTVFQYRSLVMHHKMDPSAVVDSLKKRYPQIPFRSEQWEILLDPSLSSQNLVHFEKVLQTEMIKILDIGLLNMPKAEIESADRHILIANGKTMKPISAEKFYDFSEAKAKVYSLLKQSFSENKKLVAFGVELISGILEPTLVTDVNAYKERIREIEAKVPLSSGFVYENEKIVDQHERITPEIYQKLVSLSQKMAEKRLQEKGIQRVLPYAGRFFLVWALLLLIAMYTFFEKPELLKDPKSIFLFSIVVLLASGGTFLLRHYNGSEYLVPVAMGSMLLASLFDAKMGFAGTVFLSVLCSAIWGNAFYLTVISLIVGSVSILVIKRVRTRTRLVEAVILMIGAYILTITVVGFFMHFPMIEILKAWRFGAFNGLVTPILVYGLLALFESVFDVITDFSLLELSNLNHPLLKRLSVEAPGTYHHSIVVGNLAEAGARAVGANPLLARVGSYYHDIGKIEKAEYFIENQVRGKNPHRKLSPRMSALILSNHVKKSLELAEEFHLPSAIKDIMVQHHGRSLMTYFYQKALEQSEDEEVNEEDYRYPGPKPQTKEAALVMLADAVEAASRTLKTPTHSRLKGLVEELVDERFQSGELDEAPLTLRDLQRIKESFLSILAGIFHTRLEYPEKEFSESHEKQRTKSSGSPSASADPLRFAG